MQEPGTYNPSVKDIADIAEWEEFRIFVSDNNCVITAGHND
jgi:hypothetical protein